MAAQHGGDIRIKAGPVDSSRATTTCSRPRSVQPAEWPQSPARTSRVYAALRAATGAFWCRCRLPFCPPTSETLRSLQAGGTVQADDVHLNTGDLGNLPTGTLLRLEDALGKTLRSSLGAGQALRHHQLLSTPVIRQGQACRLFFKVTVCHSW